VQPGINSRDLTEPNIGEILLLADSLDILHPICSYMLIQIVNAECNVAYFRRPRGHHRQLGARNDIVHM
jgi:hypothetical protein